MLKYKEIIRKLKDYGKVYYFFGNNFSDQEEKIEKLIKKINRVEVIASVEECFALKFEKFKLVVLKNAEKITKNSRFVVFFNEKLEDLEIEKKWIKFRKEEKKNLIECNKINARTKAPWQHIKEFMIQYKKIILTFSLIYFLIIFLGSALLGWQFFPFLISSLVFCIFSCPLILSVYKKYKASEEKDSGKKWRRVNILREIMDIINILLGFTGIRIAIWVYRLLAAK